MQVGDAAAAVKEIWGDSSGITLQRTEKGVCQVLAKDGAILGAGFSWDAAMTQAATPVLEARKAEIMARRKAAQDEVMAFMQFLREKFDAEFQAWRAEHDRSGTTEVQPGNAGGSQPDQGKLVQIVR